MTPTRGRAPRGERTREAVPRNRGTVTTMIGSLSSRGLGALMTIEGGTSGAVFIRYVVDVLVPTLRSGDIVVLDNLAAHHTDAVRVAVEGAGAVLKFLPAYSPDFNAIELAWSKVKNFMRRLKPRSHADLDNAFSAAARAVTHGDAAGWMRHCGFTGQAR